MLEKGCKLLPVTLSVTLIFEGVLNLYRINNLSLQGGVQVPTGGDSPRPAEQAAEPVRFRYQRYSPDGRRGGSCIICPEI